MINYSLIILFGGLGILTSTAYLEALDEHNKIYALMLAIIFWSVVAYVYMIERSKVQQIQIVIAIISIFIATIHYTENIYYKILYIIGWMYFGYLTGLVNGKINKERMIIGMSAAFLMITSNFVFLPLQKKQCSVEGPGMAFKGVAWALIAFTFQ